MKNTPKVSVIVPAYNEQKYIGRCLRSILSNTMSNSDYEIIVIDDCSQDDTLCVIDNFVDDVVLLKNSKNLGLPASLNKGIKKAKGQFIIRVDADDFVHNEYLNVMCLHLRMNNDLDAVACDYLLVDDHQNVVQHINCEDEPIGCAIMYRVEQLIEIGLYDEQFLSCEDLDLKIRFNQKYSIFRIPIPLYKYHIHGDNMTGDSDRINYYRALVRDKHAQVS